MVVFNTFSYTIEAPVKPVPVEGTVSICVIFAIDSRLFLFIKVLEPLIISWSVTSWLRSAYVSTLETLLVV